ncbi:hypothetical protein [Nitrosovibrio tenuis]|uniref:hypothetical protein n=1 Tax=Nitrosovibrio tenuis TaxID=1233 RepID=UPI000B81B885|nr:hypothetical protein [Nitrosovibrio tenuis]
MWTKWALFTGGSRSIGASHPEVTRGRCAALAFIYGASPGNADEVVRAVEAAGGEALAVRADSGDPPAVNAAVTETERSSAALTSL